MIIFDSEAKAKAASGEQKAVSSFSDNQIAASSDLSCAKKAGCLFEQPAVKRAVVSGQLLARQSFERARESERRREQSVSVLHLQDNGAST